MFFNMMTKVYQEENCVWNHRKDLAALGKNAIIVTGKHSSKSNGSLEDIQKALEAENISSVVFDEVEENPSTDTVMKARDLAVESQADFVIGVGGGSPLDAAKAVAVMLYHKEEGIDYLYQTPGTSEFAPVVEIPTTCGTGSEVTEVSVLTNHKTKKKGSIPHHISPCFALIDAKYIEKAPISVIRNTALDALAHLWESDLNSKATDYSRIFSHEGLAIWSRSLAVLMGDREPEKQDYVNLMNASALAGMAIRHTGTSLPHGLSYRLTYDLGLAHGKAVGYFLAGYLQEAPEERKKELLERAGFHSIEEFEKFFELVFDGETLSEEILQKAIEDMVSNEAKLKLAPFPVDREVLERVAKVK